MKRSLLIFFFLTLSLIAEEQKKIILIGNFYPIEKKFGNPLEEKNLKSFLTDKLTNAGYEVGNIDSNLELSKNSGHIRIEGFYSSFEDGSIYIQFYDPESGELLDAMSQTRLQNKIEGIELDPSEFSKDKYETWNEIAKKLILRLKSNPNRIKKPHNIQEHVLDTPIAKLKNFSRATVDLEKQKSEVFQLLAEQNVSVASNVLKEANKQPVSVTVIRSEQIRLSGARTLNDLLMIYVPGYFKVEDQDDTIAGFRGLAPDSNSKVLLLLNGFNMNTEWQFGPPDSIINSMNLDYIERIEVIRGPGSVTLGQGALLGVINIITKNPTTNQNTEILAGMGKDQYRNFSLQSGAKGQLVEDLKTYFYLSRMSYNGQKLRSEGWTKEREYEGAEVRGFEQITDPREKETLKTFSWNGGDFYSNIASSSGNRLERNRNQTIVGNIEYKNFNLQTFIGDQRRDLYNFYRDRNEVDSQIRNLAGTYTHHFSESLRLTTKTFYTQDDFGFFSHGGVRLAGTRENRYGGSSILNWNISSKNTLAIGLEYRKYDLGRNDNSGNNFIVNRAEAESFFPKEQNGTISPTSSFQVNETNRFVFPRSIPVGSIFVEDVHKINERWDLFGAFRYDKHPFWGSNISPRLGAIYTHSRESNFRFSYQEGFRGAVGVSYTGGYQKDGLLRSENFGSVEQAQIPNIDSNRNPTIFRNIPQAEPEKMRSFEIASKIRPNQKLYIDTVLFYNMIENVIDVGVIYPNPDTNKTPRIGTDEPGDWGGYFFFRNTPGILRQGGGEISFGIKQTKYDVSVSHSAVKVLGASTELHNSQYLTSDPKNKHFRAYPENVTRLNLLLYPINSVSIGLNYLYNYNWYAPTGANVKGIHMLNGGCQWNFYENMYMIVSVRNILDAQNLYPINSVAGDVTLAQGTPSYEGRTYWIQIKAVF